jgi:uncharacterized protein YeaO (DUF488 family)
VFRLKRVYTEATPSDGTRILVDRLWPRGLTKERARVDLWLRDLAPSADLRTWYGHDPTRFARFRERYRLELFRQRDALSTLAIEGERRTITLLHAAADSRRSNAAVLKELLEEVLGAGGPRRPGRTGSPARPAQPARHRRAAT